MYYVSIGQGKVSKGHNVLRINWAGEGQQRTQCTTYQLGRGRLAKDTMYYVSIGQGKVSKGHNG